jgi:DNA-binding IclR family transcriptional regulator
MPHSKLDKYLNILEVIAERPQKIDKIASKIHMEMPELKRRMSFLVANGVVEKRRAINNKQTSYVLNDRGFAVFKTLRAFKYFEKLKESMPIIDEAREIASILSKTNKRREY